MSYDRDIYMERQEQDHDLIRMRAIRPASSAPRARLLSEVLLSACMAEQIASAREALRIEDDHSADRLRVAAMNAASEAFAALAEAGVDRATLAQVLL